MYLVPLPWESAAFLRSFIKKQLGCPELRVACKASLMDLCHCYKWGIPNFPDFSYFPYYLFLFPFHRNFLVFPLILPIFLSVQSLFISSASQIVSLLGFLFPGTYYIPCVFAALMLACLPKNKLLFMANICSSMHCSNILRLFAHSRPAETARRGENTNWAAPATFSKIGAKSTSERLPAMHRALSCSDTAQVGFSWENSTA